MNHSVGKIMIEVGVRRIFLLFEIGVWMTCLLVQ